MLFCSALSISAAKIVSTSLKVFRELQRQLLSSMLLPRLPWHSSAQKRKKYIAEVQVSPGMQEYQVAFLQSQTPLSISCSLVRLAPPNLIPYYSWLDLSALVHNLASHSLLRALYLLFTHTHHSFLFFPEYTPYTAEYL